MLYHPVLVTNETNFQKERKIKQYLSMDSIVDITAEELKVVEEGNMEACFTAFDKNGDNYLDEKEFNSLCRALFRNDRGKIYALDQKQLREIFEVFDKNQDGFIDREEFVMCWNHWIKTSKHSVTWKNKNIRVAPIEMQEDGIFGSDINSVTCNGLKIVRPVNAFLVIDVQNDFISGSLNISKCSAQQNGLDVIEPINRLLDTVDFDSVFYSFDWHPTDHVSFIDNLPNRKLHPSSPVTAEKAQLYDTVTFEGPPMMKQRLWPRHCVQESWGAELHKDLKVVDGAIKIYKGTNPEVDSYSVFWDNKKLERTTLDDQLQARNVTDIYVCGLAYDVCVGATAIDALGNGYRTILIDDCCRGVDMRDIEKTKNTVMMNNGVIVESSKIKAMVEGRDRRPELGYKLAMELKG